MATNLVDRIKVVTGDSEVEIRPIQLLAENVYTDVSKNETLADVLSDATFSADGKYLKSKDGKITLNTEDVAMLVGMSKVNTGNTVYLKDLLGVKGDDGITNFNNNIVLSPAVHSHSDIRCIGGAGADETDDKIGIAGHVFLSDADDDTSKTRKSGSTAATPAAVAKVKAKLDSEISRVEQSITTNVTTINTKLDKVGDQVKYVTASEYASLGDKVLTDGIFYFVEN